MSFYSIVFSPTGGTQKAASLFAESFCEGNTCICIDLTNHKTDFSQYSFEGEDVCMVSVPSYGGRVPAVAVSRLQQMSGNGASAILIVVYGNRDYDDTFAELQDTLTGSGFTCIAAVAAVAEHSIMRQFAAGRPNEQDKKVLAEYAVIIRSRMETGFVSSPPKTAWEPSLPGIRRCSYETADR